MWVLRRRRVRTKRLPTKSYLEHKELARREVTSRVEHYAKLHGFAYGRIAIRDTRRSWGSCSSLGNLNFSYKLIFLPPHLRDYVVIHELCHLRELNHSDRFWSEVAVIMPQYKECYRELKILEKTVGTSVPALQKYLQSQSATIQVVCNQATGHLAISQS